MTPPKLDPFQKNSWAIFEIHEDKDFKQKVNQNNKEKYPMSKTLEQAMQFFDACETGKGWDACKSYCKPGATFSAQAGAIADIKDIEGYTEWMKNLLTPVPDGRYELKSFSEDKERQCVTAFAVFHGTQTGPGGPGEPTGKTIAADYVYAMQFEGGLIRHMTKIWNDSISLEQLGWV